MKLIIQVPCLNEETTLPTTLDALPREVPGFSRVEWLIVDDGSTDRTSEVAREWGVDHIVRFNSNKGLAVAFQAGLDAAIKLGADVIVTTDADNQYRAEDIPTLVEPLLRHEADMVIGDRRIKDHEEFSALKRVLQRWGTWVVRHASGTNVPDATSGFRAYTREAALRLNVVSRFTYTLETLIQAGKSDIAVSHVPIRTNPKMRESRLFSSIWGYIRRSVGTILRIYVMYEPLPVFVLLSSIFGLAGLVVVARFFYYYFTSPDPTGHVQSVIIGVGLLIVSLMLLMLGIIADLLRANRVLIERTLHKVRHVELKLGVEPDTYVEQVNADVSLDRLRDPVAQMDPQIDEKGREPSSTSKPSD